MPNLADAFYYSLKAALIGIFFFLLLEEDGLIYAVLAALMMLFRAFDVFFALAIRAFFLIFLALAYHFYFELLRCRLHQREPHNTQILFPHRRILLKSMSPG